MLKKNMRKRLLAGALATIMALTMCPTWALAGDEGITTLPAPEDQMSVVDSTSAEDAIQKTPDAETQGQTEPQDTAQAGQIENPDPAQAPSGGTDIEETGNNSNSNENDSQNNDAVSNSPANTISVQEIQSDRARYQTKAAKYFVLLPKCGTPKNNADQGQKNYLPSSDDRVAGITGSDGGVKGLNAGTGYKGFVTAEGMAALAQTSDKSITDIEHGVDEAYLEKPKDLGFFTPGNWNDDGTYAKYTNTDETTRKSLLDTTNFTFNPNRVTIVWYTIKDQSWGYGWGRVEDIHVDGYLKGIPVNVTYYPNYTTNGISGKNEDPIVDNETSGNTYTIRGSNTFEAPEGYSFGGWYTEAACTNEFSDTTTVLMSDLYLYAKWIPNPYTVTWKISEDAEDSLDTQAVNYNGYPTKDPKDQASKASDTQYDYRFKGWKLAGTADTALVNPKERAVTADVTYIAVFEPVTRQYTVTWKNSDDAVDPLDTQAVNYNGYPTKDPKDQASKASDAQYTYEFAGWKLAGTADTALVDPTTIAVVKDVTYIAVFKPITRQYTVTYYVDGEKQGDEETYNYGTRVKIRDNAVKEGHTFSGWKIGNEAAKEFNIKSNVIIQGFFTQNTQHYTINKHFYNEKDVEVKVENGKTKTGNEYALVAELYKNDAVNQTVDGKTYVYVPGLTKVTDNLEKLTKDVTIDLYYYLDVKGGEKPDETGNGTPDAWEYRLAFKVVNGEWNNGGNADIVVYVPFKDYKTGEALKYVVVPVTRIPAVGDKPNSGYRAGSWDTTPVGNAKVEKDTVFTYTYARRSSSGGGGGGSSHKPTVTIPDDVPTGLNGDDHYAYIVGYPDSTVRPQNGITRAEVATIFFRLLTDETRNANSTKSNSYSDVAAGAWYNHAVSTLSAMGIVKGDSQGKFNPNAPITRAEFAAIAARFDDKANTTAVDFSDIASHWAKDEISAAANNGWINGYTDGTFRPNNKITRAEAMTLVNRVLKRLPETAKDLHNDMIKWSDNSDTSAWYYLAVQEATNSHYYGIKENKHEKWSKLRETRDWTELEK